MGRLPWVGHANLLISLARVGPLLGTIEGIGVPIDRHRLRCYPRLQNCVGWLLVSLQPAVLGLPVVETCFTDPVPAAQIGRLHPGLVLLQDRNDLLFRMPLPLLVWSFPVDQTPGRLGSIQGGNVTTLRQSRLS
jgi:hypothetical protein